MSLSLYNPTTDEPTWKFQEGKNPPWKVCRYSSYLKHHQAFCNYLRSQTMLKLSEITKNKTKQITKVPAKSLWSIVRRQSNYFYKLSYKSNRFNIKEIWFSNMLKSFADSNIIHTLLFKNLKCGWRLSFGWFPRRLLHAVWRKTMQFALVLIF